MHINYSNFHLNREVFFVQESVLVVPKLYINIPSCVLRVIDNDNGEELPMVFMRVAPKVLQKNKVISPVKSLRVSIIDLLSDLPVNIF